jgi:preprotein translocase SecF subunit
MWVRDDFSGKHAETSNPAFWSNDVVKLALGHQEQFASTTSFEPTMAGEAWDKAVLAILFSLAAMALYIWLRFAKFISGIAAVVATIHDVLITLGAVTAASLISGLWTGNWLMLTDMKVNLPLIGAFLTLVGYSVNDTIVVFDRIRENRGKYGDLSALIINNSINQTLSRTVLTSSTVFLAVVALYFYGGKTSSIHGLAFVMLVGTVIGCYSSVAIASPILIMGDYLRKVYAWFYPLIGAGLLAYFLGIWMTPAEFMGQWIAWAAAAAAVVWIALVTWGVACRAYGSRWSLQDSAGGLVSLLAVISLLAPVLTVILFAVAVLAKGGGTPAWAAPAAVMALATCPATFMLYRMAWGAENRKVN